MNRLSTLSELGQVSKLRIVKLVALTALIVGVGVECFITKLSVLDPDQWWHLSVGSWIVQNRSFPHDGIFSHTAANRPWMAYSWGYEVLLSRSYDWFGFLGMGLFGTALTIAVAVAIFLMLYRISGRFWVAWALAIVSYSAFLFNIAPRPVFFSAILFTVVLTLLFESSRTGRVQLLYWLPFIFLLWANFHIQFIYGLGVLGLFAGINLLQWLSAKQTWYPDFLIRTTLPPLAPFAVLACCALAACAGPYSYHLYQEAIVISKSKVMYAIIMELQSLNFKFFNQYLELLLAIGAYFSLGFQKKIDPFKLALLIFACVFAFRTWRDAWFLCVVSVAIIADFPVPEDERRHSLRISGWAAVTVASVLLLTLAIRNTDFNLRGLDRAISAQYPVDAANFLRRNPVGGPLYNSFDWGGFLIFYLPQYPVSIDGRTDLYGDSVNQQYYETQEAEPSYTKDPYLNEAGVVLLQDKFSIAQLLPGDPRFRVVYRDKLAVILARNW